MYVTIDGSTLALLFYSHLNSGETYQSGFLVGQRVEDVKDRISDSQIHTADVTAHTYVSSFIPWPSHKSIHSRSGHVSREIIHSLTGASEKAIIGWYNFRPKSTSRPSLKEMSIHKSLTVALGHDKHPWDFLFFLCTSSMSTNFSTHSSDHCFQIAVNGRFTAVPMSVLNLGDTSRKEYQNNSLVPFSNSELLQNTLHQHRKHFVASAGEMEQVVKVRSLACTMNKGLKSMEKKVLESEAVVGDLEMEVKKLREEVSSMEREEMLKFFREAQKEKLQQEEEALRQDSIDEADERNQLMKLMSELGIAPEQAIKQEEPKQKSANLLSLDENDCMEPTPSKTHVSSASKSTSNVPASVDTPKRILQNKNGVLTKGKISKQVSTDSEDDLKFPDKDMGYELVDQDMLPSSSHVTNDPFAFVAQEVKSAKKKKVTPTRETRTPTNQTFENKAAQRQKPEPSKTKKTGVVTTGPKESLVNGSMAGNECSGDETSNSLNHHTDNDSDCDGKANNHEMLVSSSPVF